MLKRNQLKLDTLSVAFKPIATVILGALEEVFLPLGFQPIITDANRTLEQQKELYAQGRTKAGKIVTWTLNSKHVGGNAIDIGFLKNGKLTYNIDWGLFASTIAPIKNIEWGGTWKTPDRPHIQYNPVEHEGRQWIDTHFPKHSKQFTNEQCEFYMDFARKIIEWTKS